jgi:NitT/TauT family transport system ATP-binding protein
MLAPTMDHAAKARGAAPPVRNPQGAGIALELRGVGREFDGGVVALDSIDLRIEPGQFLALLGPSGCGKSTLLRLIAGLDHATRGAIVRERPGEREAGRAAAADDLEPARASSAHVPTAYVFQDAHLLPWRSLLHNVALPLELRGMGRAARLQSARDAIERVGLGDAADRYPSQLSGGMRMRASLARALVTEPDLLLLDEPFAALDEITRQHLDEELHRLWRERGMTVIFVTHSIVEAAFLAQRAVVMSRRPGRIVLDHVLALPPERTAPLRTDPAFSREMRILFEALEDGGGSAR